MYRGALGVVLYFGRIAGVAPFQSGDGYRVSSVLVTCAKFFITITVLSFIIFTATSPLWFQQVGSLWAFNILKSTSTLFVILAAFVSVFTSSKRMLRLMRLLKELDKIDQQILGDFSQNTTERILTILILIYVHGSLVIRSYDFLLSVESFREISYTAVHFMILIAYYMVNLTEVQLALFAKRTLLSLNLTNDYLVKILDRKSVKDISQIHMIKNLPIPAWNHDNKVQYVKEKTKVAEFQEPGKLIRQCVANYLHLCNIITKSTEGDGVLLVILIMCYILHLLTPTYKLILYVTAADSQNYEANILLTVGWLVIYSVTLFAFVEPFNKTRSAVKKLQLLLNSFMLKNLDNEEIKNELQLFWEIINLNKPSLSPLGMFTLNRSLNVKIFGGLVTYLVIIVSYGPETKKNSPS